MCRLNVNTGPGGPRVRVEPSGGGAALREWHGREAARLLDQCIAGWRDLGSFSARGGPVLQRIFLAATALSLARDPS